MLNQCRAKMVTIAVFSALGTFAIGQDTSIPDVVERVAPAVVSIRMTREGVAAGDRQLPMPLPGRTPHYRETAMGSGVIVSSSGLVLTNNHVVERAIEVRVSLPDRREFKAKVMGNDKKTDLALLKIEGQDLPFVQFGDSSKVRIGETVLAIGNPLGVGQTVSKGIISAKGRANIGIVDYEDFLQTDAAINPGNSGGALVNLSGELVGVPTAIASRTGGFQGIGFAIPSDMARQVMDLLRKDGKVSRGQMGVVIQEMTPGIARAMPGAPDRGALVAEVQAASPAEKAGLKRGDIIRKLDGEPVESVSWLRNRVALKGGGAKVVLNVWRDGKTIELTVPLRKEEERTRTLGERGAIEELEGAESGLAGVSVAPATPSSLRRLGLPEDLEGLLVTSIDESSVSPWLGLREGDVILEVNRKAVDTAEAMRREIMDTRDAVLLTIRRADGTLYVAVPREPAPERGQPNF
jgi:serine protease Do